MEEETLWETPVKGKGGYCSMTIKGDHLVSLRIKTYAKPVVLFEANIKCDGVRLYHNNIYIADNDWVDTPSHLTIHSVVKVEKVEMKIDRMIVLKIYCSDEMLDSEDLEEKR
jgi:hypothetical protein